MADADLQLLTASEAPIDQVERREAPTSAAVSDVVDSSVVDEIPPAGGEHKRKLEDAQPHEGEAPLKKQETAAEAPASADEDARTGDDKVASSDTSGNHVSEEAPKTDDPKTDSNESNGVDFAVGDSIIASHDVKNDDEQPSLKGEIDGSGGQGFQKEDQQILDGELPPAETASDDSASLTETGQTSRSIEVPNSKVGILIGKAGDTIKYLQYNSGARIQITRDADSDPQSSTRKVELIGNVEQINKAEKLIKDVIAEADAGGSPALVARGFGTVQSGGDQIEIKVPNEKVGLIIGKGGDTIKNMQTKTGARIQLIPQHLPEGDSSKERTVRITGNKKQIEAAKELIKDAMNQIQIKPSLLSGGYNQHGSRPRGNTMAPQWGGRPTGPAQSRMGYDYQQRGMYPPPQASSHYPQSYGGYSQQPPSRGSFATNWDQRSAAPAHNNPATGGYDYYGQCGPASGNQPSHVMPNPNYPSNPGPMNYNYGHSQGPGYGQPTPYAQSAPAQQNYGQGYNEPKYDGQGPTTQFYAQQPMAMQPGATPQPAYGQPQSYSKPAYGAPQEVPPSYGPPRVSQPGDPMYQGSAQPYPSSVPTQQPYPYGPGAPPQGPAYNEAYGPTAGTMDGYTQPTGGYSQQGAQAAPVYGQGGQPVPAYTQPSSQPAGYGQYPTSQQGYVDPASSNMNYPYQGGPTDNGYGNTVQPTGYGAQPSSASSQMPSAGYGAQPSATGQPGYAQPLPSNPSGYYEQPVAPQ